MPEGVLAFVRRYKGKSITCLFNLDTVKHKIVDIVGSYALIGQHVEIHQRTLEIGVSGFCILA
jgi:hypothetical protein